MSTENYNNFKSIDKVDIEQHKVQSSMLLFVDLKVLVIFVNIERDFHV
jgi:hypothetical protein